MFGRAMNKSIDTEIDAETIRKDISGALIRGLQEELAQTVVGLQRQLNTGLTQEEFKRCNAFKESVECAKLVLEQAKSKLQ